MRHLIWPTILAIVVGVWMLAMISAINETGEGLEQRVNERLDRYEANNTNK